ncbi:MAG: hypothetical protein WAK13_07500 [Terriglobales bacterium]
MSGRTEYRPLRQIVLLGGVLLAVGVLGRYSASSREASLAGELRATLVLPAMVIAACFVFRYFKLNHRLAIQTPGQLNELACSAAQRILWPVSGFLAVLAALLLLEHRQPYYFTQDDNLAVNLPAILQGSRSLFSGVFPTWNPHQFMGSPSSSLGYFALTYPVTYLSFWAAKTLLHDEYATLEVFSFVHLLLGYCVLYWAVRREGCRPSLAMLAASCCTVSGYALIFSRSWFQFSTVLLWTSLMVVCVQQMRRGRLAWKWVLAFGLAIGLMAHVGHTQMWVYSVMLVDSAIVLFVVAGLVQVRELRSCIAAHLIGFAVAAPLLVPQVLATRTVVRHPDSRGIIEGVMGLFVPDSVIASPHPSAWGTGGNHIGEMYYSGSLFMVVAAILLASLLASRWNKNTIGNNAWFLCGLLAFVLALGTRGVLWTELSYLPGFDRFRFPFKFLAYIVLFFGIGGAVALERLMRKQRWRSKIEVPLALVVWTALAYHCSLCTGAFYVYNFRPFPRPNPHIAVRLMPDGVAYYPKVLPLGSEDGTTFRIVRDSGFRGTDPHLIDSYLNQWPTVEGAFSLSGYDPLTSESPTVQLVNKNIQSNPVLALSEYGVKYVLQYAPPARKGSTIISPLGWGTPVYQNGTVLLSELPEVRPMAFSVDRPLDALPLRFDGGGATIDTAVLPQGGRVILNMLWRKEIRSQAGGARITSVADEWGRIATDVPPGTKELRITFHPPWEYGFVAGGIALVLGLAIRWWPIPPGERVVKAEPALVK